MPPHSKTVNVRHPKPSRYDTLFPAEVSALYAPTHIRTEPQRIAVSRLTTARQTFARRTVDPYHVFSIMQAVKECAATEFLTPIVFIRLLDGSFIVIDGHHRYTAALSLGWSEVNALEFTGGWPEAMTLSVKANLEIKRSLTRDQKSDAAWQLVAVPVSLAKSALALLCQVGPATIGRMRAVYRQLLTLYPEPPSNLLFWHEAQECLGQYEAGGIWNEYSYDHSALERQKRAKLEGMATRMLQMVGRWKRDDLLAVLGRVLAEGEFAHISPDDVASAIELSRVTIDPDGHFPF